ncbi:MAG: MMPL family transporter [Pseudomonadota bacterium]
MIKQVIHTVARWSYESPKLVILAYLMMFAASLVALSGLTFDMSNEGTLRPDSPVRVNYSDFKDTFGRDDFIMVAAKLDQSKSLDENLASFKALKQDIEASSPFIESIDSFTNIRYTHSTDDILFINELSDVYAQGKWITSSQFLNFSSNNPLYRNRFISSDEKYFALNIKLKATYVDAPEAADEMTSLLTEDFTDESSADESPLKVVGAGETGDAIESVLSIIREHPSELYMSGSPYILDALNKITISDSAWTGSLAMLFTILFLIYFFRRASAVVFPLSIITLSIVLSLGMMAFLGMPYTLYIGAMYPLMIAVGTADSVHIMSRFFPEYEQSKDKKRAILSAIDFSAHAILLTSVTTAVGFLSFVTGDLESI